MSQSLNTAAKDAYTSQAADDNAQNAENEAKAAEEFLTAARRCAREVLGEAADELAWEYTPWDRAPKDTEEALASLDPGRFHSFALRYTCAAEPVDVQFALMATCVSCGCRQFTRVTSLAQLGQLLAEADQLAAQHQDDEPAREVAEPLACLAGLPDRATLMTQVATRLLALHSDAGLRVDLASLYGHADRDISGELHLKATSAEAAARTARALGVEAEVRVFGDAHSYVMRRANATTTVDGISIQLSGYTRLPDDEAAAWLAEQEQTADGGES
ncbi:DUF6195 family protein [Streptomyces sp. NPDC090088]|uniref:DUF6195 family protein n=1 Tax=Streptomyces sp. NPDC090088 TaxID=3365944 RepID=UPI003821DF02